MFSNDDNSGLFTFLVGLIIIVFVGVGLSMLVDRRFEYSRGASGTVKEASELKSELDELRTRLRDTSGRLATLAPERQRISATHELTRDELKAGQSRFAERSAVRDKLRISIKDLEEGFLEYREEYRSRARAAAVGEELGTLTVRGGRSYRKAVIARVTDVGLEIRHEHGIARVQGPDLDREIRDRFQWDDEERRAKLKEELANRKILSQSPGTEVNKVAVTDGSTEFRGRHPAPESEKVEKLRAEVRFWNSRVSQLGIARSRALSGAGGGSSASVPGSLETWQTRARSLEAGYSKAAAELAAAKALLAIESPNDPLLRPVPNR